MILATNKRLISLGFIIALFCEVSIASSEQLNISNTELEKIAQLIWLNEGAGLEKNLSVWNNNEDFPSFGIGHFIWYPTGVEGPFSETFPALRDFLHQHQPAPAWLRSLNDAPWQSRDQFYRQFNTPKMQSMRRWLGQTKALQARFIAQRLESALPKLLATLNADKQRQHITAQFYAVANSPNGLYALIDYVNFKGEGINPNERYKNQGWGLLQVLQAMPKQPNNAVTAFAHAADQVLSQRVANAPRDERAWLAGWRKRLASYPPQFSHED